MSDDRARLFARLRASLEKLERRTPYPDYRADIATPASRVGDDLEAFHRRLMEANTRVFEDVGTLGRWLRERGATIGYCDPSLTGCVGPGLGPEIELRTQFDRQRLDEFEFGITMASAGIVETGTLILKDRDTSDRLAAVAPWIHVACLDPRRLLGTLADALGDLGDDPNVILVSGHSQTADVEGIMIHGVHGPGVQACLLLDTDGSTETRS